MQSCVSAFFEMQLHQSRHDTCLWGGAVPPKAGCTQLVCDLTASFRLTNWLICCDRGRTSLALSGPSHAEVTASNYLDHGQRQLRRTAGECTQSPEATGPGFGR